MYVTVIAYALPLLALVFTFAVLVKGGFQNRPDAKSFCIFLFSIILWLALLGLTDSVNDITYSPLMLNIALFVGSFVPFAFFLFAQKFIGQFNRVISGIVLLVSVFFGVASLTGRMVLEAQPGHYGIKIIEATSLYTLQSLYTLLMFGGAVMLIILKTRHASKPDLKKQGDLIASGALLAIIVGVFGGVLISQTDGSSLLSPLAVTIFALASSLAIFRHGLFDVRLILTRSIAYLLLVSTLVAMYAVIVYGFSAKLVDENSELGQRIIPIIAALLLTLSAPYLKLKFDKITNKIFFRDAYDSEVFLDELNKTLVGNIEIGILLRHTAAVIEKNLKADCRIYVKGAEGTRSRVMGTTSAELRESTLELIQGELSTIPERTVVVDNLQQHYLNLKNALTEAEIAIISSLITNYATNQEATAYLILGPKKSGNAYSKQDIRIINIIADELLIAIQNALRFEEIQNFNITLQNRINDATAKLKRSNEKLKELDETKDEFISMASHQLRTPLTSVKGYLSMVLDGDAGKVTETQQQLLNQAYVSSQRMVYLIADLLNVSRLKTGKFIIDAKPTNLADMVESEIAQLIEVAKGRKVKLTYDKPKDFPELMLDETKTRQVVMNFVDNAIYYTPSGGKIKIELRADRSSVYFMVKDNGLGVPKSEQPHMFTKFYRAKNAQKARPDGTGLGLFMAKKVINDQGGAILFESVEGKGSTFGFKFDLPRDKRR